MRGARMGRRGGAVGLALLLCLAASCATMEMPTGGPPDITPPEIIAFSPDSAAVGLVGVDRLVFQFSEKMTRRPAESFMRFYPDLEVRKTKWKSRRTLTVILADTLPADTVIVVEIPKGLQDAHRVPSVGSLVFPIATADSIPDGVLAGQALLEGEPAAGAVVELYEVPPDSVDWTRQPVVRRAEADTIGRFTVPWLTRPAGPWLVRVFFDDNDDLRPGESEPSRLWPGEFSLTADLAERDLGVLTVYKPTTPGSIIGLPAEGDSTVFGWPLSIAEDDTGFAPGHARSAPAGLLAVSPGDTNVWSEAGPGLTRLVLFRDLDGDSLMSAIPDSVAADSVAWLWEPFALVDSLEIEAGLPVEVQLPAVPDTMIRCLVPPPLPAPADTASAATDTLCTVEAPADSIAQPAEEEEP